MSHGVAVGPFARITLKLLTIVNTSFPLWCFGAKPFSFVPSKTLLLHQNGWFLGRNLWWCMYTIFRQFVTTCSLFHPSNTCMLCYLLESVLIGYQGQDNYWWLQITLCVAWSSLICIHPILVHHCSMSLQDCPPIVWGTHQYLARLHGSLDKQWNHDVLSLHTKPRRKDVDTKCPKPSAITTTLVVESIHPICTQPKPYISHIIYKVLPLLSMPFVCKETL